MGLRQKEKKGGKKKHILFIAAAAVLAMIAGGMTYKAVAGQQAKEAWSVRVEREKERIEAEAEAAETAAVRSEKVVEDAVDAGLSIFEMIGERPSSVELDGKDAKDFLTVESCLVDNTTSNIVLKAGSERIPASDDEYYYLFVLRIQNDEITEGMAPVQQRYKGREVRFQFSRHFGNISGLLYKYVIAVKKDDKYVAVSNPCYVTNPEEIAVYKSNGKKADSKKGLLVDPDKLLSEELDDLGIKHAAYNIPVSRLLGHSDNEEYPDVGYGYNEKGYVFNGEVISEYDTIFRTLTEREIEITVILLNDIAEDYPQLIHPLARGGIGTAPYYAFNGTDQEGIEGMAAIASFLAERYSGRANGRGVVANWVIGNEINARKDWNYMEYVNLSSYVKEYVRAFRVFYNSIKSINGASNIYISLDQRWDSNTGTAAGYDAKDILDEFNRQIKEEGNIEWGLAIHPYNVPLTSPYIWKDSQYVKDSEDTPMVTMANIDVVTDYLEQDEFLTEKGEVRSVTVSELGYTSLDGEDVQAAAIVYAYKAAEANPHIDSVLFSRQTDAAEEMEQGLALGLNHMDGSHKYVYNVYKYMDTEEEGKYTEFAKKIIGISDWGKVFE
ncbi:MAG TPA: hypothetical protein DCZ40_05580 [Lachnospiraceae bacterium]|nr:hypothetical protein [Lachnospiraceae bacterium]